MKPKKRPKKKVAKRKKRASAASNSQESLAFYAELSALKEQVERLTEHSEEMAIRVEDAEIHINLLTRFITTICIEKVGMRIGVLKRLLKRVEKEAVRESQILQLESLYNLPQQSQKKGMGGRPSTPKKDRWDDIS